MEAMQTLNPADVWDMVQKAIVWLAGIGIVIDLTPGIKIQPVRWLIKQLGNLMNHDLKEQLNQLENDFIYCWKAKAENLLKIKAAYPELSGTLSDFSSMTQ